MMIGVLYYMNPDPKKPLVDRVEMILLAYREKMGQPPQVVEISNKMEPITLPANLKVVVRSIHLPINHLLVGQEE